MKLLVVVLTVVACVGAVAAAAAASCSLAEEFFVRHNASADDGSETGPICGGQCCGRSREAKLRADLRKSAEHRFKTTITPLTELLLSTRRTLQVHLLELSRQSHNKTAGFFLQLYRGHAARAHTPLTNLYDDIQSLLRSELNSEELGSRPPKDLADSSRKFFREVFPVAYQGVLKMEAKQFTSVYEECLKAAYDAVLPFGDIPEESHSKIVGFFLQLYRGHAARAHTPLTNLYDDIQWLLRSELNSEELGSRPPKDLADSSRKFFREVFPVAYQGVLKMEAKQFTSEYEECLKAAYDAVLPFGDIPEEMGSSLSRSMEAVRVLLQVLAAGAGALSASERVLASTDEECYNKMLRVNGCSYCRGYNVKPCKNYCLNVARGCIGSLVAELDAPWASYTEGLERLTKPDADMALRELDTQVSKAIMYAMDNHGILESKVRQECGTPATFDLPNSPPHSLAANRRNSLRAPPPYTELLHFAAFLARNKKLFAKIGDDLCDVKNEANEQCWNGDSVGEYTKPLAASASASDQKYNPEVPVSHEDPIVAALGDRLRQARQLLVTYSKRSGVPSAEPFMQGDEAGEEGSGYDKNNDNDEDDDAFYGEGSGDTGSGMEERTQFSGETPPFSSVEPGVSHSDATTSRPILSLVLMTAVSYCLT